MEHLNFSLDPRAILGVSETASDDEIRSAYLRKLKEFPPDRCPHEFEQVREAYDLLRDRRQRFRHLLLSINPLAPLPTLLEKGSHNRKFAGPEPWLALLRKR